MDARVEDFLSQLRPTSSVLRSLYDGLLIQLDQSLLMHQRDPSRWRPAESDLMGLDSCIATLPTGDEKGLYYALDFGGTNIRVVRATIDGVNPPHFEQRCTSIRETGKTAALPKGVLDKNATATMLFDAVADIILPFMKEKGDINPKTLANPIPLGLTFSFGITQSAIDKAMLFQWSKDFETGENTSDPVVNQDVCALLRAALQRKKVPLQLVASLNDTTGTMIAAAMRKPKDWPQCTVGMILGTGVNGCYYEPKADQYNYIGRVINTECGGYQQNLPSTSMDVEADFESQNVGAQRFEKMISGHYIPELIRKTLIQMLQDRAPPAMWTPYSLHCADSAAIYADCNTCEKITKDCWQVDMTPQDLRIVKRTVDAVWERSAAFAAVLIASLAKKTGRLTPALGGVTVGIDGSVYTKNPKYQEAVRKYLSDILTMEVADLIKLQISDDGSGKGAACLAATIANAEPLCQTNSSSVTALTPCCSPICV